MKKGRETWILFLLFVGFLVLCFAFLVAPGRGTVLFLVLEALLIGVTGFIGSDMPALLLLVSFLLGLGIWNQWPSPQGFFLALAIPQMWTLWGVLRFLDKNLFQRRTHGQNTLRLWQKRADELEKDIDFYKQHQKKLEAESSDRQHLAACAKDLGTVLHPEEIQSRLLQWVRTFFPETHSALHGLLESDPVDAWVSQRRQPVLCDDVLNHPRFRQARVEPGTRALMAAPVLVENKVFGGLRVESHTPRRFDRGHLRLLDALATMASLALDNAVLFHRIEELAVRDGLTHLLTHRAFEERLADELLHAGRYRYSVCLLMADVDFFKKVNDTYGHAMGDEVLRRVARHLERTARSVDVAARYGGEEFCLVLVEQDLDGGLKIAQRLRESIAQEKFNAGGKTFGVTVSVGMAVYPDEATHPPQLIRLADQRLYRAKAEGRNRVVEK